MSRSRRSNSSTRRRRNRDRRGATMLEFALVANVLLIFMFVSIEFCRLNMMRSLAQDAAYFASRRAMVPGSTSADAISEAHRIMGVLGAKGVSVEVNGGSSLTEDSQMITVTVTVPIAQNALMAPKFGTGTHFITSATMKTERYDGFYDPDL